MKQDFDDHSLARRLEWTKMENDYQTWALVYFYEQANYRGIVWFARVKQYYGRPGYFGSWLNLKTDKYSDEQHFETLDEAQRYLAVRMRLQN